MTTAMAASPPIALAIRERFFHPGDFALSGKVIAAVRWMEI
jgi:hypothetical protein